MRASDLFESENRVYWYLSGEVSHGNYLTGFGSRYYHYIMPANAKGVYMRKELKPIDFDPETCVFTDPSNGKQYIAWDDNNYRGQDITKLLIKEYPIKPHMERMPQGGTYDANAEYREQAEKFKPTVLRIWQELQTTDWAKVDARVASYKNKQANKHPIDLNGIRADNAAGLTLLAVAKEPNKTFRSDELYYGNAGTMSNAFYKLQYLGYVVIGKKGSYNTVKITPAGIEAAQYLGSIAGDQLRKTIMNFWKKKDYFKIPDYLMKLDVAANLDFLEANQVSVMDSIRHLVKLINVSKAGVAAGESYAPTVLKERLLELSNLVKHLKNGGFNLNLPPDLRNAVLQNKLA